MKKIFTLITMFALALGAQAQTTINMKGLTTDDFTYDEAYYETATYESKDEASGETKSYPAFTYKGGSTYSALELTGKNVKFNYKNSSKKDKFFILAPDYFTANGKGVQIIIPNAKKGQSITLRVAAKSDGSTPKFAAQNALLESGDASTLTVKNEFADIVFKAVADDDVTITESDKGFNIESITITDGSGEIIIPDGTYFISFDGQSNANLLEYAEGFKLQITGNEEKQISKGANVTIDGKTYLSMKVSNTAENTLTLPAGKVTQAIKFHSYVNGSKNEEKPSYWAEVAGIIFGDADRAGGEFESYSTPETLDVREYTFNAKTDKITFTNTGVQCCYVIEINIETGEPGTVTSVTINGKSTGITSVSCQTEASQQAYNLAGQKVAAGFHGIAVKNGKKVVLR